MAAESDTASEVSELLGRKGLFGARTFQIFESVISLLCLRRHGLLAVLGFLFARGLERLDVGGILLWCLRQATSTLSGQRSSGFRLTDAVASFAWSQSSRQTIASNGIARDMPPRLHLFSAYRQCLPRGYHHHHHHHRHDKAALPIPQVPNSHRRLFSTTQTLRASETDHYTTLGLSPSAAQAEVKKQFYALSKTHHPDHNPDDPHAAERFVAISDAYSVLGNAEKRAAYDRQRHPPSSRGSSGAEGGGRYATSGGPGGRPASGLSKRRTQFRGPPPSFYRSGGWGAHAEKRSQNASGPSHQAGSDAFGGSDGGGESGWPFGGGGGFGPQHGTSGFDNDVPHFDREGHLRTHSTIERLQRRRRRYMEKKLWETGPEGGSGAGGAFVQFFVISAIISIAVSVPGFFMRGAGGGQQGRGQGQGQGQGDGGMGRRRYEDG